MIKPATFLLALIFGLFGFLIFPIFFINLNTYFSLPVFSNPILKLFGIVFTMIGTIIFLYSVGLFRYIGIGTPVPIEPPKKLVIKGVYKYTRNPMYIALLFILSGYFLFFGDILLIVYVFITALFYHLFIIYYEEPNLKKKFGKDYIKYCQKTPRWL